MLTTFPNLEQTWYDFRSTHMNQITEDMTCPEISLEGILIEINEDEFKQIYL